MENFAVHVNQSPAGTAAVILEVTGSLDTRTSVYLQEALQAEIGINLDTGVINAVNAQFP